MRVSHRAMAVAGDVGSGEQGGPRRSLWHLLRSGGVGDCAVERGPGAGRMQPRACRLHEWASGSLAATCVTQLSLLCASVSSQGLVKAPVWWPMKAILARLLLPLQKMLRESGQQALCFPSGASVLPRLCQKAVK